MKKKKNICRDELSQFIDNLLKQPHTKPITEKNILLAYKEFVSSYPDIIPQKLWNLIFEKTKTCNQITGEIIEGHHTFKPQKKFKYGQGKGGRRGLGHNMKICLNVEKAVFRPQDVLKDFGLGNERVDEYFKCLITLNEAIRNDPDYKYPTEHPIDKAAEWSLKQIVELIEIFYKLFDVNNPRHWRVVVLLFQNNPTDYSFLTCPIKSTSGKQVTLKSIFKGIGAVHRYVFKRMKLVPKLPRGKLYEAKFYYVAMMTIVSTSMVCMQVNPALMLLKRQIISKIQPLLEILPLRDQWDIINALQPKAIKTP